VLLLLTVVKLNQRSHFTIQKRPWNYHATFNLHLADCLRGYCTVYKWALAFVCFSFFF